MDNLFANTLQELECYSRTIRTLIALAIETGAESDGTNHVSAIRRIRKEIRAYIKLQKGAKELGTTLPNILKSYRMTKQNKGQLPVDSSCLPKKMQRLPYVWLTGSKQKGCKFAGMTVAQAERRLRTITPLLEEAWELTENTENELEIRSEIERVFETASPSELERQLYAFINQLEIADEEESGDWESEPSLAELTHALETATSKPDYGVRTERLETPSWD